METFSASLALCAGNSPVPVNSPHKGQWRGALMFSFIYVWINDWVNNREAGDLRRQRGHYDVIVMTTNFTYPYSWPICVIWRMNVICGYYWGNYISTIRSGFLSQYNSFHNRFSADEIYCTWFTDALLWLGEVTGHNFNCATCWRHQMETFSALLAISAGNSPVNSPRKGQWRGVLMF